MSSSTLSARPGFSACQFLTVSASYWYVLNGRPRLRDSHTANIMNCVGFSMSDELCLTVHLPVKFVLSPVSPNSQHFSFPPWLLASGLRMPTMTLQWPEIALSHRCVVLLPSVKR